MSARRRGAGPRRRSRGGAGSAWVWPVAWRAATVLALAAAAYGAWLDVHVRAFFEGRRWSLPAVVYARPLELHAGAGASAGRIERELRRLGYRTASSADAPGRYVAAGREIRIHTRGFEFPDGPEPSRVLRLRVAGGRVAALSGARGAPVALARLEPVEIGRIHPAHDEDRELLRLDDAPPALIDALVAIEDRGFWRHAGISLRGVARAALANLRAGGAVQGGSTITQQLAKNLFLEPDRTLWRKLREAAIALILEARYSKREILEAYLNEVFLGQQGARAVHGFGLAARFYFGRPLAELDLADLALLVGLVRGPSYYDPRRHPRRARARRDRVLEVLVEQGVIGAAVARRARARPLGVTPRAAGRSRYPAFETLVRRQLRRDYRERDLREAGLRIFTTLDPEAQERAERAVADGLVRLERRRAVRGLEAAAVVVEPAAGEVLAVVGGRDPRLPGFNRALDARRPIGSLVKPAVYLAALERAPRFTLLTPIEDRAVEVPVRGGTWRPRNYDGRGHGTVALVTALERSYNLATVRLGLAVGVDAVRDMLRRLGVEGNIPRVPSLLLGTLELSPLQVAQVYQTIAADGFRTPLRAIRAVTDARGRPLTRYPLETEAAADPAAVYLLRAALEGVVRRGTARAAAGTLAPLRAAGKTGTTDGRRDSWFAGFAGDRLAVVWVGRDDNRPAGLTGASGALVLWADLMRSLEPRPRAARRPPGVIWARADPDTGRRVPDDCGAGEPVPFVRGTLPRMGPCPEGALGLERPAAPERHG